ncbi:hypothetical protein FA10DRAFT_285624 [Acaromyces ingoldii]|uniref:C-CAP/cofactor C-like domain-containing protein n=1 Tax=Acaromyces ingoldii TaxID=215250 RepID=A0A316YLG8_9BASI|nr:hypothetical protein FA10DRAFT_285624 [Acaromyces ingoldii]PWN89906.1 hypothetical protein FA10DRAFT_285624 [Acaromyces ingoldii]
MASTSSLGASGSTNAAQAQQFYSQFNEQLQDLRRRIEESTSPDELQHIGSDLAQARASLTESTSILPSYDRQLHETNLKHINDRLDAKRGTLLPKKGFAFQRKAKPAASKAALATPSPAAPPVNTNNSASSAITPFLSLTDRSKELLTIASLETHHTRSDLHLLNLSYCTVDLRSPSSLVLQAVQVRNLDHCIVQLGNVDGSVMVHDCTSCLFVLGCRQFRIHTSTKVSVAIHTSSIATMEHCSSLTFTVITASSLESASTTLEEEASSKLRVQDFDHINESEPSQNWTSTDRVQSPNLFAAPTLPHPAGLELLFNAQQQQM